jgi:hypothetical protein
MCNKLVKWVMAVSLRFWGVLFLLSALASRALADNPGPPGGVPEIDPCEMGSALALLIGAVLMLTGQRRSK